MTVKTIADYRPNPLIREAVEYLAAYAKDDLPYQDEFHLITLLAVNDSCRQKIFAGFTEMAEWLARAIEQITGKPARTALTVRPR